MIIHQIYEKHFFELFFEKCLKNMLLCRAKTKKYEFHFKYLVVAIDLR